MLETKWRHGFLLCWFYLFIFSYVHSLQRNVIYSRMEGSDMMTMTYVLEVKTSMKAAKLEFLTSMLWKEAASLLQ